MKTVCRVWVRGGLGNQLASLCAGFVAVSRIPQGQPSILILDASAVNGAKDKSRRYQLHDFDFTDSSQYVLIRESIPANEFVRLLNSGMRTALRKVNEVGISRKLGVWYPRESNIEPLRAHPKFVDGHFENSQIVLEAVDLGLRFPLPLRDPSPEFYALTAKINDRIGVHVRLGDFKDWYGGEWTLSSSYYRNAIKALGENPSAAKICLFSDDTHGALKVLIEGGVRIENICTSTLNSPAEDLVYFSQFDRKVLSHSTFAWWAGVFGANNACVYPEPSATMEPLGKWIKVPHQ